MRTEEQLFGEMDLNEDGRVTVAEIFQMLDSNGKTVPMTTITAMFASVKLGLESQQAAQMEKM